jgi:hypothetical protein
VEAVLAAAADDDDAASWTCCLEDDGFAPCCWSDGLHVSKMVKRNHDGYWMDFLLFRVILSL